MMLLTNEFLSHWRTPSTPLLGYWKKNNTQKKGWARNNGEEGEGDRSAKVIMERKKEMIFHTFSDWS
jgi:hypothetical protein